MAGNFYESAEAVRLDGPILFARLRNVDGGWEDAEIDLNEFIGNVDGRFWRLHYLKPMQSLTMFL